MSTGNSGSGYVFRTSECSFMCQKLYVNLEMFVCLFHTCVNGSTDSSVENILYSHLTSLCGKVAIVQNNRNIVVARVRTQSRYDVRTWERYEHLYSSSYGLNSTTIVLVRIKLINIQLLALNYSFNTKVWILQWKILPVLHLLTLWRSNKRRSAIKEDMKFYGAFHFALPSTIFVCLFPSL